MFHFKVHWHFSLRKKQGVLNSILKHARETNEKLNVLLGTLNNTRPFSLLLSNCNIFFIFSLERVLQTHKKRADILFKFVFSQLKGIFMSNYSIKLSASNWVTLPQNTHPGAWLPTYGVFSGKLCFIYCFFPVGFTFANLLLMVR